MSRRLRPVLLLASAAALAACAGGRLKLGVSDGAEVVEATGEAMIVPKDPAGTKQRSLADAQKKAVEMVVGVHISGKTRVENALAIDQNILARTQGFIEKYEVLDEREEPPFYKTKIRAMVSTKRVSDELKSLGLLSRPEVGHPRVAVFIAETVEGVEEGFENAPSAREAIQSLLDEGYKVVDRRDLMAANAEEVAQQLERGDASGVPDLGRRLDAEVLIFGNAYANRIESDMLKGFFSYRVTLNLQAYRAQTNEILMTVGKVASGLDPEKVAAATKALENAGRLAGKDLSSRLARELASRASVAVSVKGVGSLDRLKEFQKALDTLPGVSDYYLRSFSGGRALLDVEVKGVSSQDIASDLEKNRWARAKIGSVTADTLEVELQP